MQLPGNARLTPLGAPLTPQGVRNAPATGGWRAMTQRSDDRSFVGAARGARSDVSLD
jgi:hypothetical protein